ncbi:AIPR family protein [Sporosarcina sp. FA15]|uniref:AIPR family protein n=1 Tax=Sporosarcina sp. FA15 TaxID=3413031 RepID=UPI003F65AB2F
MSKEFQSLNHFKEKLASLSDYGSEGWALFALQLYFGFEDIDDVASVSVTDGKNDRKCDLIYIDKENKRAVIIQTYCSTVDRIAKSAKKNKAGDLNTALTWALNMELEELHSLIRPRVSELRDAINENEIEQLDVWYVHNCHEHKIIKTEMLAVEKTARSILNTYYADIKLKVSAIEVGIETIEEWYMSTKAKILVDKQFEVKTLGGYEYETDGWKVYSTAVTAEWVHSLFKRYGDKLFSANIRNYLGSMKSKGNVNNGIKDTVSNEPKNFLVYNNGITALVNDIQVFKRTKSKSSFNQKIIINGISIVNGAQTTGAMGQFENVSSDAIIPIRFIESNQRKIVTNVIKYNNSQNVVQVSDFRSTDIVQERLREEFRSNYPKLKYLGGRRGNGKDTISRDRNLLVSDQVAQSLMAFHDNPTDATHSKSKIWEYDELYSNIFNENTTADHIVFVYSIYKAFIEYKQTLKDKSKINDNLTTKDENILSFFSHTGSIYLMVTVISTIIEEIVEKKIASKFSICFKEDMEFEDYVDEWKKVFPMIMPLAPNALTSAFSTKLKNVEEVKQAIAQLKSLVEATKETNQEKYNSLKALIKFN